MHAFDDSYYRINVALILSLTSFFLDFYINIIHRHIRTVNVCVHRQIIASFSFYATIML